MRVRSVILRGHPALEETVRVAAGTACLGVEQGDGGNRGPRRDCIMGAEFGFHALALFERKAGGCELTRDGLFVALAAFCFRYNRVEVVEVVGRGAHDVRAFTTAASASAVAARYDSNSREICATCAPNSARIFI